MKLTFALADTFGLFLILSGILARGVEVELEIVHSHENHFYGNPEKVIPFAYSRKTGNAVRGPSQCATG